MSLLRKKKKKEEEEPVWVDNDVLHDLQPDLKMFLPVRP